MKIKIDRIGTLHVCRGHRFKPAQCPFDPNEEVVARGCGDWCALFGEPAFGGLETRTVTLSLCRTTLYARAADFTDERKG